MHNRRWLTAPFLTLLLTSPAWAQRPGAERLAPYVPSPQKVVERMLEAADLKPNETVYDLGCGDGRILFTAAREFRAKAVGIEINDKLVRDAREEAHKLGLDNRVEILEGDLMHADLRPADVVTVYLLTDANDQLKPIFEKALRRGARVVSHDFKIRGWKPDRVETVEATNRTHYIYVYTMPPKRADSR